MRERCGSRAAARTPATRRPKRRRACGWPASTCARSSSRSIRSGCARCWSSRCCSAATATRCASPRRCRAASGWAACGTTGSRVAPVPGKRETALVLERVIPDLDALSLPTFDEAERSVLADDIKELEFAYFGRDRGAAYDVAPTWREPLGRPAAAADPDPRRRQAARGRRRGRRSSSRRARRRKPDAAPGTPCACSAWAYDDAAAPRARAAARPRAARHRAHHRALDHDHAHGDRQRLRVRDAQRGAVRAQRAFARAGARGGRRRRRAHGVRARAPALPGGLDSPTGSRTRGATATSQIVASAVDESAKIDLNAAPETLLKGLIEKVGGADPEATARIVDAIQDWRDADDLRRPNGAEEADYKMAGLQQKPANMPFETVSELARVLGMTPAIYARVVGSVDRELAATRHQRDDGVARRAARVAQRDARGRRRVPHAARGGAGGEAAGPAVSARRPASARARCPSGASAPRRACPMV